MEPVYTASAVATGDGRNGHVRSSNGRLDLDVRVPEEMGGPGGATNPEELFAAGYAACFHSAIKVVGRKEGVSVDETEVVADVSIGDKEGGGFQLAVSLEVAIPGVDPQKAQSIIEQAHQICPYSNATRGNIEVGLAMV